MPLDDGVRREQFKLVYDYIKFHIGLYLATPTFIALIARTFGAESRPIFQMALVITMAIYLVAGVHAGWFMGKHINTKWAADYLDDFEKEAFPPSRRFFHHWLYWIGLGVCLAGLLFSKVQA